MGTRSTLADLAPKLYPDLDSIDHNIATLDDANTFAAAQTFTIGYQMTPAAVTATANGLTTGVIAAGQSFVSAASGNAAHIILLPPPTPGHQVLIHAAAAMELRAGTSAGADGSDTISINGNTPSAGHESALPANSLSWCICISATAWLAYEVAADGSLSAVEAAA